MKTATLEKPTEIVLTTAPLSSATESILNFAFDLHYKKETLSRKEYKQLIQEYDWSDDDKKYIKVGGFP